MNIRRVIAGCALLLAFASAAQAGEGAAVIVGVSDDGAGGEIVTAQADANATLKLLVDKCGYAPARTIVMTSDSAAKDRPSLANIKARIEELAKSGARDDRVLVYFTGRAVAVGEDDVTLVPAGGARDEGVSLAWVRDTLAKSAARSKAVILDLSTGENDGKAVLAAAVKTMSNPKIVPLVAATGSKDVWTNEEGEAAQRSSFSVVVGQVLSGKGDLDGDSCVTMHELAGYLHAELTYRRAKGVQGFALATVGCTRGDRRRDVAKLKPPPADPEEEKLTADEAFDRGQDVPRAEQVKWFSIAIRLNPDSADAWHYRGYAYFCLSRNQEALTDWNECLEIAPDYANAYNMRGNLLTGWHMYDEALLDLNKAVELSPRFGQAIYHRARVYLGLNKFDLAVNDFTKAIDLLHDADDQWRKMHLGRAKAYYGLQDYDKAWADVKVCREKKIPVPDDFIKTLEEASGKKEGQ